MNIYANSLGLCGIACVGYLLINLTVNACNGDFLCIGDIVNKERDNV